MPFTYTSPTASNKDRVRFLIGDTDSTDALFQDAEIQALIDDGNSVDKTALMCAESLAAKWSRKADMQIGDLRKSYGQIAAGFTRLAARLKATASLALATPYAGGISVADKLAVEANTDRVAPAFRVNLHENPGTSADADL